MTDDTTLEELLVDLRHDLHRHPELGLHLPHTQATVLDALADLDLEVSTGRSCTSVTAVLRGGSTPADDRRTVLLRGDMDALPLEEAVDVPWRSEVPGVMHACGHDLHTAMLVGAAHLLAAARDELPGDVVFMFQPGEEGDDGAAEMIAEGVLDASGRRADAAWAIHVLSGRLPAGVVASRPGPLLAACSDVFVTVSGTGGHGSAPHLAGDPVPATAAMVTGLHALVGRITSPFDPVVLTVGELHAGTRPNIIPPTARFGATVRCFDPAVMDTMEEAVTAHCRGVAAAHGLEVEVDFQRLYPVTTNDGDAVTVARSVVDRALPGRWHELADPVTGSEDFSRVLQAVPGAMLFLGACLPDRDPTTAPDNHSPDAAYDDGVLLDGATLLAELATTSLAP